MVDSSQLDADWLSDTLGTRQLPSTHVAAQFSAAAAAGDAARRRASAADDRKSSLRQLRVRSRAEIASAALRSAAPLLRVDSAEALLLSIDMTVAQFQAPPVIEAPQWSFVAGTVPVSPTSLFLPVTASPAGGGVAYTFVSNLPAKVSSTSVLVSRRQRAVVAKVGGSPASFTAAGLLVVVGNVSWELRGVPIRGAYADLTPSQSDDHTVTITASGLSAVVQPGTLRIGYAYAARVVAMEAQAAWALDFGPLLAWDYPDESSITAPYERPIADSTLNASFTPLTLAGGDVASGAPAAIITRFPPRLAASPSVSPSSGVGLTTDFAFSVPSARSDVGFLASPNASSDAAVAVLQTQSCLDSMIAALPWPAIVVNQAVLGVWPIPQLFIASPRTVNGTVNASLSASNATNGTSMSNASVASNITIQHVAVASSTAVSVVCGSSGLASIDSSGGSVPPAWYYSQLLVASQLGDVATPGGRRLAARTLCNGLAATLITAASSPWPTLPLQVLEDGSPGVSVSLVALDPSTPLAQALVLSSAAASAAVTITERAEALTQGYILQQTANVVDRAIAGPLYGVSSISSVLSPAMSGGGSVVALLVFADAQGTSGGSSVTIGVSNPLSGLVGDALVSAASDLVDQYLTSAAAAAKPGLALTVVNLVTSNPTAAASARLQLGIAQGMAAAVAALSAVTGSPTEPQLSDSTVLLVASSILAVVTVSSDPAVATACSTALTTTLRLALPRAESGLGSDLTPLSLSSGATILGASVKMASILAASAVGTDASGLTAASAGAREQVLLLGALLLRGSGAGTVVGLDSGSCNNVVLRSTRQTTAAGGGGVLVAPSSSAYACGFSPPTSVPSVNISRDVIVAASGGYREVVDVHSVSWGSSPFNETSGWSTAVSQSFTPCLPASAPTPANAVSTALALPLARVCPPAKDFVPAHGLDSRVFSSTVAAVNAAPIAVQGATDAIKIVLPRLAVIAPPTAASFSVTLTCPVAAPVPGGLDILPLAARDSRLSNLLATVVALVPGGPIAGSTLSVSVVELGTVTLITPVNQTVDRNAVSAPPALWGFDAPSAGAGAVPSASFSQPVKLAYYILEVVCGPGRPNAQVACGYGSYGEVQTTTCLPATLVPLCASFDLAENVWSAAGCQPTASDATSVTCACSHLTDFAARFATVGQTQQGVFAQALSVSQNSPFSSNTAFVGYVVVFVSCGVLLLCALVLVRWDRASSKRFYESLIADPELQALAQLEAMKYGGASRSGWDAGAYSPWRFDAVFDPPEGYVPPPDAGAVAEHSATALSAVVAAAAGGLPNRTVAALAATARTTPLSSRQDGGASSRGRTPRGLGAKGIGSSVPSNWLFSFGTSEPHSAALYVRAVFMFNEHRVTAANVLRADSLQDPSVTVSSYSTNDANPPVFVGDGSAEEADAMPYVQNASSSMEEVDIATASKAWLEAAAVLPTPEASEVSMEMEAKDALEEG